MPVHEIIEVLDFEDNQAASKINMGYFAIMLQFVQLANAAGKILRCLVSAQIGLEAIGLFLFNVRFHDTTILDD